MKNRKKGRRKKNEDEEYYGSSIGEGAAEGSEGCEE